MNAISKPMPPREKIGTTNSDGSLTISADQLARFGGGDAQEGRHQLRLLLAAERDQTVRSGPTPKPQSVRIATIKDERAIFDLLMLDLKENAEVVAPIDQDRVARHIMTCTRGGTPGFAKGDGICGVIDGPGGIAVAVVILIRIPWWWSNASYWQEMPLYVHPDHRRSSHAADLANFAKWWAEAFISSFGYRMYLLCGVLGTHRVREKTMFYRRRFAQVGSVFLYPAVGGESK